MTEFEIAIGSICMVIGCAPLIWAIQSWLFAANTTEKTSKLILP